MPYVGNKSTTFNTFSATDVSITDDLTVTDDATIGGALTTTGNIGIGGAASAFGGDVATFQLKGLSSGKSGAVRFIDNDGTDLASLFAQNDSTYGLSIGTNGGTGDFVRFHTGALGNTRMLIDATGAVTKPLQPAFSAKPTSQIDNLSVGGSDNTHVVFGTERFDTNADYNTSTGVFTAPVTGKYLLCFHLRLENIDTATTTYDFIIATSNIAYTHRFDPDFGDSDTSYYHANLTVVADMDASDTANVEYYVDAGTAQTDIDTNSYFMGYLLG